MMKDKKKKKNQSYCQTLEIIIAEIIGVNFPTFFLHLQFLHDWKYTIEAIILSPQTQTYLVYQLSSFF